MIDASLIEKVAKIQFETYVQESSRVKLTPRWDALVPEGQDVWRAVARAVLLHLGYRES